VSAIVWAVFGVGLVAALANTVGILASAFGSSDYYPLGERDRNFYVFWGCSHLLNLSLVAVGVLQWQAIDLPWIALPVGAVLVALGFAIAVAGSLHLGLEETQGMRGQLRTDGLYRYSRNPQYVGYLLATVGFPLLTAAPLTVPLAGIYLVWWLVFPIADEPWLCEEYGEAYEQYAARVPRFVGRETVALLFGAGDEGDPGPR